MQNLISHRNKDIEWTLTKFFTNHSCYNKCLKFTLKENAQILPQQKNKTPNLLLRKLKMLTYFLNISKVRLNMTNRSANFLYKKHKTQKVSLHKKKKIQRNSSSSKLNIISTVWNLNTCEFRIIQPNPVKKSRHEGLVAQLVEWRASLPLLWVRRVGWF